MGIFICFTTIFTVIGRKATPFGLSMRLMPLSVFISAPEESNVVCAINRLCDFAGLDTIKEENHRRHCHCH